MPDATFEVEQALLIAGRQPVVLARALDQRDFTVAGATLAGCALEPELTQPRAHDAAGQLRSDLVAFTLVRAADLAHFRPGERVVLRTPAP